MMVLGAQAVEKIGFVAAFCTTVAFVPQLVASAEAAISAGYIAGNLSAVLGWCISLVDLRHLQRIEAGDCIQCGDTRFVAEYFVFEDAV